VDLRRFLPVVKQVATGVVLAWLVALSLGLTMHVFGSWPACP
jgi:hypothetical protein